jgi:hypothetical protein
MKINWKVLIAVVVIVLAAYWAVDSVRTRSYSGSNLTFGVGTGPVTITNPSDVPILVQFVGTSGRSFNVTSNIEGVAGASVRTGTGRTATQVFEFSLPAGVSEFAVLRGTQVNFVAPAEGSLEAVVQPVSGDDARNTLMVAGIAILGALFFISNTTGHQWLKMLRGKTAVIPVPVAVIAQSAQGREIKSYGDNSAVK